MAAERSRDTGYLPFVDGLRAVAILAVVSYHIGLPIFPGGFIGVDVFFVISGFLIVGHITGQMDRGRFSLLDFYARRALRLLPLLLTVILASCVLAPLVFVTPDEYKDFGGAAAAAAMMVSNHFFLASQGYFDRAADTKVLLHTWSLGVEAQFYAVAPMVIAAALALSRKIGRKGAFWIAGIAVATLSFAGCIAFTKAGKNTAFFLMVFRAWEFAAGAAVPALANRLRSMPESRADLIGITGLAAIVACAIAYNPLLAYPSWWPLLPVLGTTIVIGVGEAFPGSSVCQVLTLRPLVAIGLVSYGWYLWHWPLLTFSRIYHFGAHNLVSDTLVGGFAGLALATITYFVVERPVARHKKTLLGRRRVIPFASGIACCLLVAVPGHVFEHAVAHAVERQLGPDVWPDKPSLKGVADACIFRENMRLLADCRPGPARPVGLLVGDSHARDAYPALVARSGRAGSSLITMVRSGCPPLFSVEILMLGQAQGCHDDWETGVGALSARHPALSFAILESSWSIYVGQENGGRPPRYLADSSGRMPAPDQYAALADGLKASVAALRKLGVKRILIIAPEPQFLRDAPECLLRARKRGLDPDMCSRPRSEIEPRHRKMLATLESAVGGDSDIRVADPFPILCDGETCPQQRNGVPLYIDDNHLSEAGYDLVFGAFAPDLAWAFGGEAPPQ